MSEETTELSQYVPAYRANLNLAPQQTMTKLLSAVDGELNYGVPGEFFNADDVHETDPEDVNTRVPDTPDKFIGVDRRVGMFSEFHDSAWFDNVDKVKEITDPTSAKMQSLMAGRWRKVDNKIMNALLGNALVKTDNTDASIATSAQLAGQIIAVNEQTYVHQDETIPAAAADYGMSIGKLINANLLLDESELDGERFVLMSSIQKGDLLQRVPATSKFYAEVSALANGKASSLPSLGMTVITMASKRMLKTGANRRCIAWIKPALQYKARMITNASIRIRTDKSDTPQAFYKASHAAVRRYDLGVVEILCKEG